MYFQLEYIVLLLGQKGPTVVNRLYVTCISTCMYIYVLITIFIVLSHNDL